MCNMFIGFICFLGFSYVYRCCRKVLGVGIFFIEKKVLIFDIFL